MWQQTAVARRLGLSAPIIQGPFGSGLSSVDLVASVAECGMLGSYGAHHLGGDAIRELAAAIRARTSRPFALNLWLPFAGSENPDMDDQQFVAAREGLRPWFEELGLTLPARPARFTPPFREQLEAVIETRPAVFSFIFGVPEPHVLQACRERNIVTLGTATTPAEAVALERAGVDMIVATGFEAGGHRVSFLHEPEESLTGTLALVPQVVDAVKVPVIAAGGIADGRGVAAALMLGAQGVQIGTAFLACEESAASALHREKLFGTGPTQTALTRGFSGRLARGIRNRFMDEATGFRHESAPYPVRAWLTGQLKAAALKANRPDVLALWCGQGGPLLRHRHVRALATSLVEETTRQLALWLH